MVEAYGSRQEFCMFGIHLGAGERHSCEVPFTQLSVKQRQCTSNGSNMLRRLDGYVARIRI